MDIELLKIQDMHGCFQTMSSVGIDRDTGELATWDSLWGWQTESHNPEREWWKKYQKEHNND